MLFKLWYSLNHTQKYILTDGADVDTPEGLQASGLGSVIDLLRAKQYVSFLNSSMTRMKLTIVLDS